MKGAKLPLVVRDNNVGNISNDVYNGLQGPLKEHQEFGGFFQQSDHIKHIFVIHSFIFVETSTQLNSIWRRGSQPVIIYI